MIIFDKQIHRVPRHRSISGIEEVGPSNTVLFAALVSFDLCLEPSQGNSYGEIRRMKTNSKLVMISCNLRPCVGIVFSEISGG